MRRPLLLPALLLALAVAGPAAAQPVPEATAHYGTARAATTLLVRGTTDVDLFAPLFRAFAEANPEIAVAYEQWGSNALSDAAAASCRGAAPAADLLVSSSVDQQVRLVNDGCAQPHHSAAVSALPPAKNWRDELFGVTEEPAVIVYNRDRVPAAEVPRSRFDLIDLLRPADSAYVGRVATYDLEVSGLGYLFAFTDSEQATTFGSLIEAFAHSRSVATCCSTEIIDAVAEGRYLIAYNVLGSYAFARAAADRRLGVVTPEDYTLVLSRAAMIPKAAPNPVAAGFLVDFMLSEPGRAALAAEHLLLAPPGALGPSPADDALFRPIPLSPTLLVGLDRQKRAAFLARWRSTFAEP